MRDPAPDGKHQAGAVARGGELAVASYRVNLRGGSRAADGAKPSLTMQPFDLFATRIWQAPLDALTDQIPAWIAEVVALRAASPEPAGRTLRQGWNSQDERVLERPAFADLRTAVRSCCAQSLREMGVEAAPFELQSWVNLHDQGGFNFPHIHEGSLLSGSVYLQIPPGSGPLVLRDPRPQVASSPVKGSGPNGHMDVHLWPQAGLLVLFPCWLEHFVEPHQGETARIAIAFNARRP